MKLFLTRIIALAFFMALTPTFLHLSLPKLGSDENHYIAAMIDKHAAAEIEGARLFVAGGSNVAFGVDSETLSRELSLPVVNLGLHAGLGLDFILEELKVLIRNRDIVVVSPEYLLDSEGRYKLKRVASDLYPMASSFYKGDVNQDFAILVDKFKERSFLLFPSTGEQVIQERDSSDSGSERVDPTFKGGTYLRSSFNKWGDHIGHLDSPGGEFFQESFPNYLKWDGIMKLNQFASYANDLGVQVFFAFPPFPKSSLLASRGDIDRLESDLASDLSVEIINRPLDVAYENSHFFDSVYHLNRIGRASRTENLLKGLLRRLSSPASKPDADY